MSVLGKSGSHFPKKFVLCASMNLKKFASDCPYFLEYILICLCIWIVCFPDCHVINFEITLSF